MNVSNTTSNNFVFDNALLDRISDIIGFYFITLVSIIGLALNLFSIKLLMHKSLKHEFYKYLKCKSIFDSIVCLIGVGYLNNNCLHYRPNFYNTYGILFYLLYLIRVPIRMTLLASALSEVYLTFNRIFTFTSKTNILKNISIKYYMTFIWTLSISLVGVSYFSVNIKETNQTGMFYWSPSTFGMSGFYKSYILVMLVVETVFPALMLTISNIIILISFKQRMNTKINLQVQSIGLIKKSEIRFTKMILILTGLFMSIKFFDMLSSISFRYATFYYNNFSKFTISLIDIFRQLSYLLIFMQYVLNIFIYVVIDPNLHKVLKGYYSNNSSIQVKKLYLWIWIFF